MNSPSTRRSTFTVLALVAGILAGHRSAAQAAAGKVTIPIVTGREGRHAFTGHPGWVDVYGRGDATGIGARIGADATFSLPVPGEPIVLVAYFDKMETPPVVLPRWPGGAGGFDIPIAVEYACVPPGYPDVWDRDYKMRSRNFWQSFVAGCTHLYGCSVFDGPKVVDWGNKINVAVTAGGAHGERQIIMRPQGEDPTEYVSAGHSNHELPRMGWRHGDIQLVPGRKYAINVGGYRPHGGEQFELDAYVRPDRRDGYGPGEAQVHRTRTGGDLCCLVFGNGHGQIVENHVRSEEWEVFIPRRAPTRDWGQTFRANGLSMAGVSFWGSNGSSAPVTCDVRLREGGPGGRQVGPTKTAQGHDSPVRPIIRYPEIPSRLEGHDSYYALPCDFFQVAWLPDEAPLRPGETYYVELRPSMPMMLYADGDYYDHGYAYYQGRRIDADLPRYSTFHSRRWTLAANLVTYERASGAPNVYPEPPRPPAAADGNLIANGGAETGDFRWWEVGSDPQIDPTTHIPVPPNHSGQRRFGISVGWTIADMYQYQEVPGIEPGAAYCAGMWAVHQDGTDERAELLWSDGPFGGEEHLLARTDDEPTSGWKHYESAPFRPSETTVTIIIRYRHSRPTNIASIHVDDISLKRVRP